MACKDKEKRRAYLREYYRTYRKAHREEYKDYQKKYHKSYYKAHKEEKKVYDKVYHKSHKEEIKIKQRGYQKSYQKIDTNSSGIPKNSIRVYSRIYLFNILKHTKLKGYEIHHCFGYDDYKSFIYIPKEFHLQIHQYLRDNVIAADSNHFSQIVHLINAWNGYTYIKV